jgi:hypothetical protein
VFSYDTVYGLSRFDTWSVYPDVSSLSLFLYPLAYPDYNSWLGVDTFNDKTDLSAYRAMQNRCGVVLPVSP